MLSRNKRDCGRNEAQLPLSFASRPAWDPPNVARLPRWGEGGGVVAIDTETRDDHIRKLGIGVRRGGYIVGYSFAVDGGPSAYIPIRHASGDNVPDPEAALAYLRDQARTFRGIIVGGNLNYDLDYLAEIGIDFPHAKFYDIQVADALIYEMHDSYSVQAISERRGLGGKNEALLRETAAEWGVDPKSELWKLPGRAVTPYGIGDVELPLAVRKQQLGEIADQGLEKIVGLEHALLPVLVRMRRRGVRINMDKVDQIEKMAAKTAQDACKEIERLTGYRVAPADVMAGSAIVPMLHRIGVHLDTTQCGLPSIDKAILEKSDHPAVKHLLTARRYRKLQTTYVGGVRKHEVNGRIHATFNQTRGSGSTSYGAEAGTRFGRVSSSNPNLQNQPARDPEIGKLWRSIYEPEEGRCWASMDYSQQEPRVLVHYAETTKCTGATVMGDRFRQDRGADTYQLLCELAQIPRSDAKTIYLGLAYGMGEATLCHSLKLPTGWVPHPKTGRLREVAGPEGKRLLQRFHSAVPFIQELNDKVRRKANHTGWIVTLLGRRCRFPEKPPERRRWPGDRYDWTQKALNRLIQGGSSDQTKKALVEIDQAGHFVQLQVHDEVAASVADRREADQVAQIMRDAVKLTVPMSVDIELGPNWGGSMK